MPVRSFLDPLEDGKTIPLEEGPAYFEERGLMPAEAVEAIRQDIEERRGRDPRFMSPSKCNPRTNCRRQIFLERFIDYDLDPRSLWAALEGTIWHSEYQRMSAGPDWQHEVRVPEQFIDDCTIDCKSFEDGVYRVEVFPGVWMGGTADRLNSDLSILKDHKTTKFPFATPQSGYTPKRDYREDMIADGSIQLSLYARMIEKAVGDIHEETVKELWIWRTYMGSRNEAFTFAHLKVPRLYGDDLWAEMGGDEWMGKLLKWLEDGWKLQQAGADEEHLLEVAKNIPMDGHIKQIFNGQKCTKYCAQRLTCWGLEGDDAAFMEF